MAGVARQQERYVMDGKAELMRREVVRLMWLDECSESQAERHAK